MKTTILKTLVLAALLVPLAVGCDDDDAKADAAVGADARGGPGAKPALGAQIDRMGRPAINTAANKTFTADVDRRAAEDAYNHAAAPATWGTMFGANIKGTLAILDALDATCGNQLLANADPNARYGVLASVLADDMLQVNSSKTACAVYLGVEARETGIVPSLEDCGGRPLAADIIETSYSALAAGVIAGVDDGIAFSATVTATFPYLGPPTN